MAVDLAQLGQQGDERGGQYRPDARHGGEQPISLSETDIGRNDLGQALVEERDVGGKPGDSAPPGPARSRSTA